MRFIFLVTEFISEGELFEKIKHFSNKLIKLYVAELSIVIGESYINKLILF